MRVTTILPFLALAACGPRAASPPPEPAPPPAAPRAGRAPSPPSPPEVCRCIRICFVRNGRLTELPTLYNTVTSDTMTRDSQPFSSAAPRTGAYASVAGWYVDNEPITFRGQRYLRYGRQRVLAISEIERAGEYGGVPLFIEAGDTTSVPVLYLPTRPGCEFEPFVPTAVQ